MKQFYLSFLVITILLSFTTTKASNTYSTSTEVGAMSDKTTELSKTHYLGIGIGGARDYDQLRLFADIMKTARPWYKSGYYTGTTKEYANHDANYWPTEDAECVLFDTDQMNGYYSVSFTGQATIKFGYSTPSLKNQVYNPVTNKTTATIIDTNSGRHALYITFTNTKLTPTSATNTGVKDVKIMRPLTPGNTLSYPETDLFTNESQSYISKFQVIRFMDYLSVNSSDVVNWTGRTLPTRCSQAGVNLAMEVRGGCYEYMIQFGNITGKDVWLNIHHKATDDYITKLAQMFKYGSDGVNPYTSKQANPVYPPLNSNLKLYVEWSNEIWNSQFVQTNENRDLAKAEVAAGGSPLNFDGDSGEWTCAWRRTGKKAKEMSEIFRSVFGDSAMMTRIRPVYEWQQKNGQNEGNEALSFLARYYGNSMYVSNPHSIPYWFYGGGGSSYYQASNSAVDLSIDNIWTRSQFDVKTWEPALKSDADLCYAFGLKRIAYEGGPGLDDPTSGTDSLKAALKVIKDAAVLDPRMLQAMKDHQEMWDQYGGDLNVYYQAVGDHQWGFTNNIFDLSTYKIKAIDYFNTTNRAAITYGSLAPCSFTKPNSNGWTDNYVSDKSGYTPHWISYIFRVETAGIYNVKIDYTETSNSVYSIDFDGNTIATNTVTGTGSSSSYTINCEEGFHGIRLWAKVGKTRASKVYINAGPGQITIIDGSASLTSNNENVIVYPNPASDIIKINVNSQSKNRVVIEMFDLMGKKVLVTQNVLTENQIQLDTKSLSSGMYTLKVNAGQSVFIEKVMIKR